MNPLDKIKEFLPTSWAIDNRKTIYFITFFVTLFGILTYYNLPKTNFPDVVVPQFFITTIYPGTSPEDMENLVTRPLEKQMKSISGIKHIKSNSLQDFCNVSVEFNTDVDVAVAKQKVKDAVDKASGDLPNDLPNPPSVIEFDFSEMPIMFINLSGDFPLDQIKEYAEILQDEIESLKEITRADLIGARDKEVQIHLNRMKMQTANITFYDLENTILWENRTISAGNVEVDGMNRAIRVKGEFDNINDLQNLILKNAMGQSIYLRDIATIAFTDKDIESYARYNGKNVISLSVIKRGGENLIAASDKIHRIIEKYKTENFPSSLNVSITADQSETTRNTLSDLVNSIIIGFLLVLMVLMFFMGVTNAFFVALSVPLSVLMAFLVMPFIGFELNMIVLFGLLFALGIVVDDAIVVIENTYRLYNNGERTVIQAAKLAAGEVWAPVLAGTFTTLAPFVPLAFWPGIVGKFMFYLPITLILTLLASLMVAFLINPVFAVSFMRPTDENITRTQIWKKTLKGIAALLIIGILLRLAKLALAGNLAFVMAVCIVIYHLILKKLIHQFEYGFIPSFIRFYGKALTSLLRGIGSWLVLICTVLLLVVSILWVNKDPIRSVFFPAGEPNSIYAYIKLPVGTNVAYTDSITRLVENKIYGILGKDNPIVESIQSNVAIGAGDDRNPDERTTSSNKGKVSVSFKKYAERVGQSTQEYMDRIRAEVKDIPGAAITIDQEANGPPTGAPVNIEIAGEDLKLLMQAAKDAEFYLDSLQIKGVEELKSDFVSNSPELIVNIHRESANRAGLSTAQIGSEIRTSVFGKEVSTFRQNEDEYPIMIRADGAKDHVEDLMDTRITFRDNTNGMVKQVPVAAVADIRYSNTYGGIKRKNLKRVITLSSNVTSDQNANEVNAQIDRHLKKFRWPKGVSYSLTGEQEDQMESMIFLLYALVVAMGLIMLILVTQFNSISKPVIILSEILFSIIGVLLGFKFSGMEMSIVMTGIGIVGLAGIVVKNGILIVEFADLARERGASLSESVIGAGMTRLKPVLLTAIATMLGLVPLALGLNINFSTLLTDGNPHWFLGGDSVVFWGPLSWTIIFGLSFATFLTLVVVPAMYLISEGLKERWGIKTEKIVPLHQL